ncbi:hypothetical protein CY35_13G037000 [Sphagnum magellanicum]|nr:hypothetical protein CY35_13G037000 [Sphagnum magellanicum]KAH9542962.1 hypothetical protein CY35_13G037000 [Sphagnum magellanicum]KAH9542963.1 hypothetical protein CY35_13G037000 [Sphagnum magellanicum]KAH9542964.1 hypothetical protein CY35_13G037000 [Sphagnum magellanicum]
MAMSRAASTYAVPSYNATPDLSVKGVPPSLLSPEGSRLDGRLPHECRPAYMKTGAVNAAAGSAYAEFGQTKVIVSVYGPRESKKAQAFSDIGRLNCDVKFASFSTSVRGKASQGMEEKEYTGMLHKALECAVALHTFPKTTVDVFALILQSGGGDLAVVISCASMALADAGIVMYDLVPAVSLSCTGSEVLLDASMEEEKWGDGGMIVAAMTSRNEITQLTMTGEWPSTKVSEALQLCLDACLKLAELMRSCLKEQVVAGGQ